MQLVVEIQAMIYNVAWVRRLSTKFPVDTCKTKKDRSAHAQLRTWKLRSKASFIMPQGSGGYLQNFKSMHAELKKIDLAMHRCAKPWFIMRQGSGGYLQNCNSLYAILKKDRYVHAQLLTL